MANTLFDLAQKYLQQGLPDIGGIFPPPPITIDPTNPIVIKPVEEPTGIETLYSTKTPPRDDFPGGGGRFGDLDMDDKKTITRNVYTKLAPGRFDFVPTEITAYKNMRTGAYQTEEGKNVDGLLTDAPVGIFNLLSNFLNPKQIGAEYPLGKIQGNYTNLASLLKGVKNPTNLITQARKNLIDQGSQITEEFGGAGEFPTDLTPRTTAGFAFEDQSYDTEKGGSGGSGGSKGPGDMNKGVGGQSMGPGGPGGPRRV
jgi:hypothetical protein